MNQNSIKDLSIQISLSGLSFCILNRSTNTIIHINQITFEKKTTPFDTLEKLIRYLDSKDLFEDEFHSVLLIYDNELSTLVPKSLFNEANSADYLKFNAKILNTDFITHDELAINDTVNVFVPYVNVNNYIFDRFGTFEYKHASSILIDSILQKESHAKDKKLFINIENHHFEIIATDNGQLIFYNTFEYQTKEDFIYFVLFTIEQLKLNPETILVKLMGNIEKGDSFFSILFKYIRFVDFIEPFNNYNFKEGQQQKSKHNRFVILNSFS